MKIRNITPKQINFQAKNKEIVAINTKDRTINLYDSYVKTSQATGFKKDIIRECVVSNRQLAGSQDYIFLTKDELNIHQKENGELVFDEEEIKQSILQKITRIKEREEINKQNTIIDNTPKPVVLMDNETKKARRYPNIAEAGKNLGINKHFLRKKLSDNGYVILSDKKILIPLGDVTGKDDKLDKTKYSYYLNKLEQKGYKEPKTIGAILSKYINRDEIEENIKGIYLIDKNGKCKKFTDLNSFVSFLNIDKNKIYSYLEQDNYCCSGFVLIPAYFFEKSTKEGNILDEKLLQKIVSITKDFATKEF